LVAASQSFDQEDGDRRWTADVRSLCTTRLSPADEARTELARELHDRVAQNLTSMLLELELFKRDEADREVVARRLGDLQDYTREVLTNVRELLYELRGAPGVEHHFARGIRKGLLRQFSLRTGVEVRMRVARTWPRSLPSAAAINLYRILQEALNNVRLHSGARRVWVTLQVGSSGRAELTVRDDGRGIAAALEAVRYGGMGWLGMSERAVLLGGELTVASRRGGGTTVRAGFPGETIA
jgi:signal transduction histidine kinase